MAENENNTLPLYNDSLEHAKVIGKLDTIDSIPEDKNELKRDLIIDIGTGAALGSLGGLLHSRKNAKKAVDNLKKGVDSSLGSQARIVSKSEKRTPELVKAMQENSEVAKKFVTNDITPKNALGSVLKNTQLEAEIGPNYIQDISNILSKDTGKTNEEIKKAIKKYLKDNEDSLEPVKLLEVKDNTTYQHSIRVAKLSKKVALEMGMNEENAERLAAAAMLHDIGKLVTPDRATSSTMRFENAPELRKWFLDHPNLGGMILSGVDPYAAQIAYGHHKYGKPLGTKDEKAVTIADIYDAITSPRGYKNGHSSDFALYDSNGIKYNISKGETTEEYLDLLKSLKDKGMLDEGYPVESDLEEVFPSMKANAIKKEVGKEYKTSEAINGAIIGANTGLLTNGMNDIDIIPNRVLLADKGGLGMQDSIAAIPTASEILKAFIPGMIDKKEKLQDIKRWYINILNKNPEARKMIMETDFNNNKSVTKTWRLLKKMIEND